MCHNSFYLCIGIIAALWDEITFSYVSVSTSCNIGPSGALSIEAVRVMTLASEAIHTSQEIRKQVASAIDHTHRLQQAAHEAVNDNIIKKIAQTVTLTVSSIGIDAVYRITLKNLIR